MREQAFLRDAKEQLGVSGLLGHAGGIITALSKSINSNIRGSHEIAGLLDTVASSVDGPVRQVRFPNNYHVTCWTRFDQPSAGEIRSVVRQFLGSTVAVQLVVHAIATRHASRHHAHAGGAAVIPSVPGLSATPSYVLSDGVALGVNVPFSVYVPALSLSSGSPDGFRPFSNYVLRDPCGQPYRHESTGQRAQVRIRASRGWTGPIRRCSPSILSRALRPPLPLLLDNVGVAVQMSADCRRALAEEQHILDDLTNACDVRRTAESAAPVA